MRQSLNFIMGFVFAAAIGISVSIGIEVAHLDFFVSQAARDTVYLEEIRDKIASLHAQEETGPAPGKDHDGLVPVDQINVFKLTGGDAEGFEFQVNSWLGQIKPEITGYVQSEDGEETILTIFYTAYAAAPAADE